MINNNSVIDLVNLDPNVNKEAFINYLQTQPRFQGYNFAGDDMNVLLDIMMINYFRYAFYLNMSISEGFLDSAQLFDSVKSHAKDLNYIPRSMTSACANITVSFTATGESQPYIIPKGSGFASQVKNQAFTFSTMEPLICASANNSFSFTTNIYEGIYVKDSYIFNVNEQLPFPSFTLTNANVDLTSLVVNVFGNNSFGNSSADGQSYNLANTLLDLTSNSYVYFLQCSSANGNYEVVFGDGILGNQPLNGSLVVLDYRVPSGPPANGAGLFNINFDPTNAGETTSSVTITTNSPAIGGAFAQNIESTRFYAPRWFQVQERCVINSDYEVVLQQQFPEIQAINAYGGETLTPPQFGKTVIAIQLSGIAGLPLSKIVQYTNFLKGRNVGPIQPIIVQANNTYLQVNSTIKYNTNITSDSPTLIGALVSTAITNYNNTNLDNFDVTFYYSQFCDMIDEADMSIVSNLTTVQLYQKIYPTQNGSNYYLTFPTALLNNTGLLPSVYSNNVTRTITSSNFYYQGNLSQLDDNGAGTIRIVNVSGGNYVVAANVGTVTYASGIVNLINFSVDSYSGDSLQIFVVPVQNDISVKENTILSIEPSGIAITVQQVSL